MLGEAADELINRNLERITNPKQCENGHRTTGFHHLPVAHAEAEGDHVFLA